MSLSIRTNIASIDAQNNLAQTQSSLTQTMDQLSSGDRITSPAIDAAGLGISTNLEAQIASYTQAGNNANDGISLVQTASGALNQVTNILTSLRNLAMESASDGVGPTQRAYIVTEAGQLQAELDRINATTEYNGNQFFANGTSLSFEVGIRGTPNDAISVDTTNMKVDSADLGVDAGTIDLSTDTGAQTALTNIDNALDTVSGFQATLGAASNRFQSAANTIQAESQNLSAADSRIRDVNVASATSELSREQVLSQAGIAVLAQANAVPQEALKLLNG
ncbi:MAG TPA: flagellin [Anaeromyxobacteraceae bacterium]|nr:flagellin [Anaeromyxobacteraceae bacterium]